MLAEPEAAAPEPFRFAGRRLGTDPQNPDVLSPAAARAITDDGRDSSPAMVAQPHSARPAASPETAPEPLDVGPIDPEEHEHEADEHEPGAHEADEHEADGHELVALPGQPAVDEPPSAAPIDQPASFTLVARHGPRRAAEASPAEPEAPRPIVRRLLDALTAARPRRSRLRGDIEGLRALAVIWVLLFHLRVTGFGGGYAGVDVFFVISGFLITSQLLASVRTRGRLNLVDFYGRRAKRLLPAATLVLVVTVLFGWAWLPRSEWQLLAQDSAASAVYSLNWFLAARSVDYLAMDAQPTAVQHFWSLAVEEQFYIVWPLVIIASLAVARWRGWPRVAVVAGSLGVILVASLAWSIWYTQHDPGPAYFVSTTRAWELALGGLLAAAVPLLHRLPQVVASLLAPVGLAMVVASALVIDQQTPWPGSAALLPTVGAGLVVLAGSVHDRNLTARLLGWGPLPWIGMLSYSMYLWHWPLIVFWTARDPELGVWEKVVIAVLTVTLSALTLRFVEDPVRFNVPLARRRRTTLVLAVAAMATSLIASMALLSQAPRLTTVDPLAPDATVVATPASPTPTPSGTPTASASTTTPAPFPTPKPVVGDYTGALSLVHNADVGGVPTIRSDLGSALRITRAMSPSPDVAVQDLPDAYRNGCHRRKGESRLVRPDQCLLGDPAGTTRVALVGDSKMDQWQPALDLIGKRHGWRVQGLGKSGCTFSSGRQFADCDAYNAALIQRLLADPPDIVMTSTYAETDQLAPGMIDLLSQLQRVGVLVVLINDNPTPPGRTSIYQCIGRTDNPVECEFARNRGHGAATMADVAQALPEAEFIDMNEWICPPGLANCPVVLGNVFLYRETSHLTSTFVRSATPILERKLVEAGVAHGPVLPLRAR